MAAGLILALCASAQIITTVAGTDFVFPSQPILALKAPLGSLSGAAVDAAGNIYVVDSSNNEVMQISPDGILTVVAGNGFTFGTGDGGLATDASLAFPNAVALDANGNLYIAEFARVRKVSGGIITTVAGTGEQGFSGDGGPATSATIYDPQGLAVDTSGNLYIADTYNNRIRKVSGGTITTVAGNGSSGFSGDGDPATSATLDYPWGLTCDAAGNLYISDNGNNRIRKVSGGIIATVAGNGNNTFSGDGGLAVNASLSDPFGVAVDAAGNLYIADSGNFRIRKVSQGIITTVAGTGAKGLAGDGGPALSAMLEYVTGIALDSRGTVYFTNDPGTNVGPFFGSGGWLREVTPQGVINTVAGNGNFRFSGDGGAATSATLNWTDLLPAGVAIDGDGALYIADTLNNRIRKVSGGIITTVAGNGTYGFSGEGGLAVNASLAQPTGLALDQAGALYIADVGNSRVRKVSGSIITTVAGGGTDSGDGESATSAELIAPTGVAVDSAGDLFIADSADERVRRVSGGVIATVAGTGNGGFSGDGGQAISAELNDPTGVAVDSADNVYIADLLNNRIREVSGGIITTVAGSGTGGYSGDGGPATSAELGLPSAVAVDSSGNIYISDSFNSTIRKVSEGIITTVAGTGPPGGFSGDGGIATDAMLEDPTGIWVDSAGNIFIADTENNRVREVLAVPPQVQISPNQLQFSGASNGSISPPQNISLTSPVPGLAFSVQVSANATWLNVTPSSGASPRLIEVSADPTNLQAGTYSGTITITAPYATPASTNVQVTFAVGPGQPPQLAIDKSSLSFPFPQNGTSRSQTINISNAGGGALAFSLSTQTSTGGTWLSAAPNSGQVSPNSPATVSVTANPQSLQPGTYAGTLTITADAATQVIPVTMTISQLNQAILLSQTGLSFLGVANGGVILPQSFGVINIGSGVVNWTVSTSTLSGGNWIQIDTTAGSTDASANTVPTVVVSASVAGLAPGKYYGQVRVDSPGAANTPQVLTAFLQVLPAGSATSAAVQPGELLFTATAGTESPPSQEILVSDISGLPTSFRVVSGGISYASPVDGTLDPQSPTHVVVQPVITILVLPDGSSLTLPPGVYNDVIALQFSDGTVSAVNVKIVVAAGANTPTATSAQSRHPSDAGPCQPTQLLTALTTLGQSFAVSAGFPVALGVEAKDDCGNPLDTPGTVVVSFSNGDPSVPMQSLKGGYWEGTWSTSSTSLSQVYLTIRAWDPQHQLQGVSQISGALQSPTNPPAFTLPGVVSAAEPQSFVPAAPGSIISIFGNLLAEENTSAPGAPLPTILADTLVTMAGELVPLFYASQGQVNALVPYDIDVNTPQQIYVQRGLTYSQPVSVNVAPAQPAIFEDTSVSPNQGIVIVVRGQGASETQFEAKPGTPAIAGDVIVAYCAGLGAVSPPIPSGSAAGSPLSKTTNTVQLTIGGRNAPVVFSGLTPGFVGLYQVNATVPNGVPSGNTVPVTISVAGQTSPPVTMAIQ